MNGLKHIPVMLDEAVEALAPKPGGVYLDCTCGGGGHAGAILEASAPDGRLLGLDRDAEAVARCENNLGGKYGNRVKIAHSNFSGAAGVVAANGEFLGAEKVDGVIMDLGVSSFQIDEAERGFSFSSPEGGPLDMRMSRNSGDHTAKEVLDMFGNDHRAFAKLLRDGEEPAAQKLAKAILSEHAGEPFRTTSRLASFIEKVVGGRHGPKHPATLVFQILRMTVNDELEEIRKGVGAAIGLLREGGRLAVISFESLSDRQVKALGAVNEGREISLQQGGSEWAGTEPRVKRINKRVITPGAEELKANPRSRSAKLRIVERVGS